MTTTRINPFMRYAKKTATPPRKFNLADVYTPSGKLMCETAHYAAFEISDETHESGFIATVYSKRDNGRYSTQPVRFCMVRGVVLSQLENLEKGR